jgi:phosphatidylglycerophosphate synthase
MFDAKIRPLLDPGLNYLAAFLVKIRVKANSVTTFGFLIGLLAVPLVAFQFYQLAIIPILLNRLCDGLDGALARQTTISNVGGYLDIVLDFIFYSAIIFAFALAQPENAIYSAFLIFSFIGTGTTFLAFAIFAERLNLSTQVQGKKSFYYLAGLAEGFETIAVLIVMCLFPTWFWLTALCFAIACWLSAIMRILASVKQLSDGK